MHTPATYVDTPVETMLPVRFDPDEKWEDISESVFPVLTAEGRNSMVMTLGKRQGGERPHLEPGGPARPPPSAPRTQAGGHRARRALR